MQLACSALPTIYKQKKKTIETREKENTYTRSLLCNGLEHPREQGEVVWNGDAVKVHGDLWAGGCARALHPSRLLLGNSKARLPYIAA